MHDIVITPAYANLCGEMLPTQAVGDLLLVELYHKYVADYPKFFKMDTLSRLGFVASELLCRKKATGFIIERTVQ